jgi:hypothetical protein
VRVEGKRILVFGHGPIRFDAFNMSLSQGLTGGYSRRELVCR